MTLHKAIDDQNQKNPSTRFLPQRMRQLCSTVRAISTPFKQRIVTMGTTLEFRPRHLLKYPTKGGVFSLQDLNAGLRETIEDLASIVFRIVCQTRPR